MTRSERIDRIRVTVRDGTYPLDASAAEDAVVDGLHRDIRYVRMDDGVRGMRVTQWIGDEAAATGDALPADPGPLVPRRDPQPDDAVPEYLALIGALCSLVAVVLLAWAFDLVAWLINLIF